MGRPEADKNQAVVTLKQHFEKWTEVPHSYVISFKFVFLDYKDFHSSLCTVDEKTIPCL